MQSLNLDSNKNITYRYMEISQNQKDEKHLDLDKKQLEKLNKKLRTLDDKKNKDIKVIQAELDQNEKTIIQEKLREFKEKRASELIRQNMEYRAFI